MVNLLEQSVHECLPRINQRFAAAEEAVKKQLCPSSLERRILQKVHWQHPDGGAVSPGMKIYNLLARCLDGFTDNIGSPVIRSFHQRVFHRHMTIATLPLIFRGEWQTQSEAIKQRLKITEKVLQQVVISTPRRYGKSFAVAMFVAACLYAIPGFSIVVFSVAQRQSDMLMNHIRSFFDTLPGAKERYKVKNAELFEVYDSRGGISTLRCLPGRSETTRGVGANMIILEEAAFINEKIFYDVIVPLLGVKDTVLIGISTPPKDGFNYYLGLFDCNDANGEPIFKIEKVELQCKECQEKQQSKCPHIKVPEPKWKTSSRKDIQKRIYAKNPDVFRREVEGLAVSVDTYVFHGQNVDALMRQAKGQVSPLSSADLVNFVFIGIDPSGGGNGSDTAFVALTYRARDFHPVVSSNSVLMFAHTHHSRGLRELLCLFGRVEVSPLGALVHELGVRAPQRRDEVRGVGHAAVARLLRPHVQIQHDPCHPPKKHEPPQRHGVLHGVFDESVLLADVFFHHQHGQHHEVYGPATRGSLLHGVNDLRRQCGPCVFNQLHELEIVLLQLFVRVVEKQIRQEIALTLGHMFLCVCADPRSRQRPHVQ